MENKAAVSQFDNRSSGRERAARARALRKGGQQWREKKRAHILVFVCTFLMKLTSRGEGGKSIKVSILLALVSIF